MHTTIYLFKTVGYYHRHVVFQPMILFAYGNHTTLKKLLGLLCTVPNLHFVTLIYNVRIILNKIYYNKSINNTEIAINFRTESV